MTKKQEFFWTLIRAVVFSLAIDISIFATAIVCYLIEYAGNHVLELTNYQIAMSAITVGTTLGIATFTTFTLVENGKLEFNKGRWMTILITFIVWLYTIS